MDDETPRERERRLIAEAERRARVDEHLKQQDRTIATNTALIAKLNGDLSSLDGKIDSLGEAFRKSIAIAEDRAKMAEKAAKEQVTSRQLFIAAIGVTVAILGTLAGSGALG